MLKNIKGPLADAYSRGKIVQEALVYVVDNFGIPVTDDAAFLPAAFNYLVEELRKARELNEED